MSEPAKPNATHLGWEVTSSEVPFENKRFMVRSDSVRVPKAEKEVTYAYVERAKGLLIVPVTPSGEVVLIHQYRYPVDEWVLETPAGSTSDTGDLPDEEVVRKELKEEIGATAGRIQHIGTF